MRYAMTITALASSLALVAATQLPAKAGPAFDLKSTTGLVQLVGHGGGGGHGGGMGGHMGGGMGGHMGGHMGGGGGVHIGHMGGGGGGHHMGHIARGGDFNVGSSRHGRSFANNNWNGNWDRRHRHNNRVFVGVPLWYGGGYYAYNGYGECGWLRRQAIITGSPYWWQRYQECLYY